MVGSPIADPKVGEFDHGWHHTFVEIDYEIFSTSTGCQLQAAKVCALRTCKLAKEKNVVRLTDRPGMTGIMLNHKPNLISAHNIVC